MNIKEICVVFGKKHFIEIDLMKEKLPLIEQVYRWIDLFTYFDYSECLRNKAYNIATINQNHRSMPHMMAAISIFHACAIQKEKFNFEKIRHITETYRHGLTPESGMKLSTLEERALSWTLPTQ